LDRISNFFRNFVASHNCLSSSSDDAVSNFDINIKGEVHCLNVKLASSDASVGNINYVREILEKIFSMDGGKEVIAAINENLNLSIVFKRKESDDQPIKMGAKKDGRINVDWPWPGRKNYLTEENKKEIAHTLKNNLDEFLRANNFPGFQMGGVEGSIRKGFEMMKGVAQSLVQSTFGALKEIGTQAENSLSSTQQPGTSFDDKQDDKEKADLKKQIFNLKIEEMRQKYVLPPTDNSQKNSKTMMGAGESSSKTKITRKFSQQVLQQREPRLDTNTDRNLLQRRKRGVSESH
jgi:hypothetical protein